MATNATSKIDAAAEKAYAEAAAKKNVSEKAVEKAVEADAPKPKVKPAAVKKAVAKKAPAKKTAAKKAPAKKRAAPKKVAAKKAPAKKVVAKKTAAKKAPAKTAAKTKVSTDNPVIQLKDKIMATAKTNDFTAQAKEMAADVQERFKTAAAKAGEFASEAGEFNKANIEAVVESGKVMFAGAQDLVRADVETGKTVVETVTADVKKMAAVKSPTELMQLQGELARRNFDAVVSYSSKRTEEIVKLYNDAFAPISSRMSVAAEKISKAA
ncbi:phasin family protein [Altererythrobacter lutimaris]|uniref:Phasin family protein n=1 Tax=Altererythrobacter lutimaris TaxID=2743979 RepID=A0A850HDX3_9SPHN|nr:phasin family protein [Altererythrobacter lutimaris]NVE95860.1 phasin family protein [Altererythrobacter lutimaris]